MDKHPITELMDITIQKLREMIDVNTVVGNPITTPDGTTLIPVSKIAVGFGTGGSDIPSKNSGASAFGGGGGAGNQYFLRLLQVRFHKFHLYHILQLVGMTLKVK